MRHYYSELYIRKDNYSYFSGLINVLMISCLVFSYSYMGMKMVVVALALIIGFIEYGFKLSVERETLQWFGLYVSFYAVWIIIGFIKGNSFEGLYSAFKSGVLYSVIYFMISCFLRKQCEVERLLHTIEICNFIVALVAFVFILFSFWGIQLTALASIMGNSITGVSYGHMAGMGGRFIHEMIFTTPFIAVKFFTPQSKRSVFSYANLVLSSIVILMSGRRVIQIEFVAALACSVVFFQRKGRRLQRLVQIVCVLLLAIITYQLYLYTVRVGLIPAGGLQYRLSKAFEMNNENARYAQFFELMSGFRENPILGSGIAGELSNGYKRALERPWFFELSYISMLFHVGIVGGVFYLFLLTRNYVFLYKIKKKQPNNKYCFPLMFGYSCILLANAVDPYLEVFDMVWMIFIIPIYYRSVKEAPEILKFGEK